MDYFLGQIKSKKIPILCPEQNCNKEVAMFDLKHILSSKDIQNYENSSLNALVEKNQDVIITF